MISGDVWHFRRAISHKRERVNDCRYTTQLSVRETNARLKCRRRKSISASRFLGFPATDEVAFRVHMAIGVICPFLVVSDNVLA